MICELVPNKLIKFEHVLASMQLCASTIQIWHTHVQVFCIKKYHLVMYNFGDAMWFASGEENNGQGDIYVIYFL